MFQSGSERSSRSRISSTVDIRNENGEIDYKKLYEEQLVENDRLKDKLRKSDEDLKETKQTLERINVVVSVGWTRWQLCPALVWNQQPVFHSRLIKSTIKSVCFVPD